MKKIIIPIIAVAAFAAALVSCQKQELVVPETSQEVTLTFSSEKPAFDDETKTEWNGETETIQWSEGDKISVAYTVGGKWQSNTGNAEGNAKIYQSNPIDEATSVAHFSVPTSFTGTTEGTHIFYAVYPALGNNNLPNAPVANISISPNQNPKADSFDSSADVMIGETGEYNARPAANETISLMWNRLVAHAVLTLNNINGFTEGEVIDNITLTAQSGANLVGLQDVNLITREYEKNEGNTSSNVLKVSAKNLIVNNGTVTFWACVLPETLTSLTVEVETNKATYTREISGISKTFKQNARNILSIKMNEAVREEKVVDNNEVVDVLNRALTGVTGTSYAEWSAKTSVSDAVYAGQSAGGNESIQLRSSNSNSGIVTTTSGGFAKKVVVTWNSNTSNGRTLDVYGSNTAYTNPTELYNTTKQGTKLGSIVCGTSTELVIDGDYEFIALRSNSGAMYVEEIKITWSTAGVEPDTTPKIVVSGDTTKDVVFGGETVTFNYELKNLEAEELTWEVSNPDMISSVSAEDGVLTVNVAENDGEERTATITLSCGDANDVVLTINQGAYVDPESLPKGIAAIKNAATSTTESDFDVTLTDAVVTYVSGSNAYIEDAEAGILVYMNGHGLKVGDKLNGEVSGKVKLYSNLREITAINYTKANKTEGAEVPVTVLTLAQLNAEGAYDKYENMRIKIVDATVTAEKQISQDDQTYDLFFKNNAVTGFDVDNIIDVIGYPSKYDSAIQLIVWENAVFKGAANTTISGVSDVTVEVGATKVINATASSGAKVSYVSANTGVATVDENGTVTGVAEGETIITVSVPAYNGYPAAEETCKVTVKAAGGNEPVETITVSKSIKDISGTPTNGTKVSTLIIDDFITASASTAGNNGKVYNTGAEWRLYQSDNGTVTISAKDGSVINSVKLTYSVSNTGTLMNGNTQIESAVSYDVKAASVTYSVGNTGAATNGQVKVTAIEVVYQKN